MLYEVITVDLDCDIRIVLVREQIPDGRLLLLPLPVLILVALEIRLLRRVAVHRIL